MIKEYKPKFNVQFKDDKGYPWIKIEVKKTYPSAKSYLGKSLKEGNFYGPFPNGFAVRDALKLIQKLLSLGTALILISRIEAGLVFNMR